MQGIPYRAVGMVLVLAVIGAEKAWGELPAPAAVDFPFSFASDAPGAVSAAGLLDKPAGRAGPVVVKGNHFYTGDKRIRFWGANFAFSACFPTHEEADQVAARLAHFGFNAVRLHHMDNQKFPNGIFADDKLETLSDEALDRLDYLVAALRKQGIYSNINLHVSRPYAKTHKWPGADKLPETYDKLVDLFHPELIAAEKRYAKDLLTHVNRYTGKAYASEPAVCMVEINNENTLFLWSGEEALADLPEPYAGMLKGLWNQWLVRKYGGKEALAAAWNVGAERLGENLVRDRDLAAVGGPGSAFVVEQHDGAKMAVTPGSSDKLARVDVTKVDGTSWHLQLNQGGLKVKKGQFYTVSFRAKTEGPKQITVTVLQAHEPWQNLGLSATVRLTGEERAYRYGFVAGADDANARVSFAVGWQVGGLELGHVALQTGGQVGLDAKEDAAAGTVEAYRPGGSWTVARRSDWYDFLQQTDERYFVDFRDYLRDELKVAAPVTGTIGLGPLGTLTQSKMDFVDAHAYWDHPQFPGRAWSASDWRIRNLPMVDNPAGSPLWGLAATHVAGKPFTVTEYNHSAPNDWQAECVPLIATYAALQDWDGVYLFAYSHGDQYKKDHAGSFFDIEGNWTKMALAPLAARIFVGAGLEPLAGEERYWLNRAAILPQAGASYHETWKYAASTGVTWQAALSRRLVAEVVPHENGTVRPVPVADRVSWEAPSGAGSGRFVVADAHAAVFTGFAAGKFPVALGEVRLERLETPFAAIMVVPANAGRSIADADRLLVSATARCENTGEQWNVERTSVSTHWGQAPPRIEVVRATLHLPHDYTVRPLDGAGRPTGEFATTGGKLELGQTPTVWYELVRK